MCIRLSSHFVIRSRPLFFVGNNLTNSCPTLYSRYVDTRGLNSFLSQKSLTMKIYFAALLAAPSCVAFQQPVRRAAQSLNPARQAIAIPAPENTATTPETEESSAEEPFDMTGIALSVSQVHMPRQKLVIERLAKYPREGRNTDYFDLSVLWSSSHPCCAP